jgi:transglutaminase-like putative cysteine protease
MPVVLHELLPRADGLVSGFSDKPAVLFEDERDVHASGEDSSREGGPTDIDDDLVYRTMGAASSDTDAVHTVDWEVKPDRETARQPWLRYHAVFDPAIIPFKRNSVWDRVRDDGVLVVGSPELTEISVVGDRLERGRQAFWGSVLVDFTADTPVPIPSVAPSAQILGFDTAPEVALRFFRDGADNYFVSAGAFTGRVRVNVRMDAPNAWFQRSLDSDLSVEAIPPAVRPRLPTRLAADVDVVAKAIGVRSSQGFATVLRRLVRWFRSFKPGELSGSHRNLYRALALGQKGICRHRAYAFVVTAHGLGIPARYVANEAHVFVEVYIPDGQGWLRIDLGGGALGMTVRNGADKSRHTVLAPDPFDQPPAFRAGYSHRAFQPEHADGEVGDEVRGLPGKRGALNSGERRSLATSRMSGASHGIPLGEAVPFEMSEGQVASNTRLDEVSGHVYRGKKLHVSGAVNAGVMPLSGAMVRINLMDRDGAAIRRVLGTVQTDQEGVFRASLTVPLSVDPGIWEVMAEFVGNDVFAPSRSQ